MEWVTFLQHNFSAILPVMSALIGVIITSLVSLWRECLSSKAELDRSQAEWAKEFYNQHLTIPITSFVDRVLTWMDNSYWRNLESSDNLTDNLVAFRSEEGAVKARIAAMDNDDLTTAFNDFSRIFGLFRNRIRNGELDRAYDELRNAQEAAGRIYRNIRPYTPRR